MRSSCLTPICHRAWPAVLKINQAWLCLEALKFAVPSAQNALPDDLCMATVIPAGCSLCSSVSQQEVHLLLRITGRLFSRCEQGLKASGYLIAQITRGINQTGTTAGKQSGACTLPVHTWCFLLLSGYFQSSVTTVRHRKPLQCQSSGAAEDHQPPRAVAQATALPLSGKRLERKASTFHTLCNL